MMAHTKAECVGRAILVLLIGAGVLCGQEGAPQRVGKLPPLELLQHAHTLFVQGDYDGAEKYYFELLPTYPKSFDILKNLAYCYYAKGPKGMAQAARYYARAYEIDPGSTEVSDKLSRCYMELRRYREAAAILVKMARSPAAPPEAWKLVAEAYDAAQRISEAEAAYDIYLQRNPGDLGARSNLGVLYSRQKAYAKAMEQFRIVLSANPNFSAALIGMARALAWQGQYEEGLRLYNRVLLLSPLNGDAESGKAFVLLWTKRPEEAHSIFTRLRRRYPRDGDVARGLQTAEAALEEKALGEARRTGSTAPAEAYYRQRLARDPKALDALKALAEYTGDSKRCAESIGFGRRAWELSPSDPSLELRLARSLTLCQQHAEAIARYRRFLQSHPQAEDALWELGNLLLRTRRSAEAAEVFRNLLHLNPRNTDAGFGLAQALAAAGNYAESLLRYDEVLKNSPQNYDALQGKAFVLLWNDDLAQSRAIFQSLAEKRPSDPQNAEALEKIARAEEEARWAALRPTPDAPPQEFLRYYLKRLASYPDEKESLRRVASLQAQLNNLPAAMRGYKQVLEMYPDDRDAKLELARLLSWDRQYDASIKLYQEVLSTTAPEDPNVLDNLARVYLWSGRTQDALQLYQGLLAKSPSNTGYQLQVARLELRLKNFPAAREALASLLGLDPKNREARLQLAELDLNQGKREESLKQFDNLLKENPKDPEALHGKAQVSYYQGDLGQAYASATTLVTERPNNFDAVLLLATIEHARRNRRTTLVLLDRAAQLSPNNADVAALKKRIREESAVTITTSASFAREIGETNPTESRAGFTSQDLRTFSYGTTFGFSVLPRTDSYFSLNYLPSNSPIGGLSGAVAPGQVLYRQSTRLSPRLTLRMGAGLVRFGPGEPQRLPGQPDPVPTATIRPLAQGGFTFAPRKKLSFDLDVSRSAIAYTPTSVRFGVMRTRIDTGLNFFFDARTEMHLEYFHGRYASASFDHVRFVNGQRVIENKAERDRSYGGSLTFSRNLLRSHRFSLDSGYDGSIYGYEGRLRDVFLGFFNPSFYQRHLLTKRLYGKLVGPVSYDLSGGLGVQQTERGGAIRRGLKISPSLTVRVSNRFSFSVGYTHYNTAQALGVLSGNAFRFSTSWRL